MNTELRQMVLLQVSFCELHIDMLKQMLLGFPWHMMKTYLSLLVILICDYFFHHNDEILTSAIKLCVVCIQTLTHQESLNHWRKRRLRCISNPANLIIGCSFGKLNAENISSGYSDVVLPYGALVHTCTKDAAFENMCYFTEKYIKFSKMVIKKQLQFDSVLDSY